MKLRTAIILLITAFITHSYSQVILKNYTELNNGITLDVQLLPTKLLEYSVKDNKVNQYGYFDEGSPNQLALPCKTIIVGLPIDSKPTLTYSVKSKQKLNCGLSINPKVRLINDSTLSYDFSNIYPKVDDEKQKVKLTRREK